MRQILVIDVGGSNVKLMMSRHERRKFNSGPEMTPKQFAAGVNENVQDWKFDAVSIGFPAPVKAGVILAEPKNLGAGWLRFDFRKLLGKPVMVVNDAALQALGSYRGHRMLFLGLGTGLGSTLVWKDNVLALELGDLPYADDATLEQRLGKDGLKRSGKANWTKEVLEAVARLKMALIADYVVLGGGSAKLLDSLPGGVERGHNRNAYVGGMRLWQTRALSRRRKWKFV